MSDSTTQTPPEPEQGQTPDPIAALEERMRAEIAAKISTLTSKVNGELAGLRRATKGDPPPQAASNAEQISAEETFAFARRIARAEAKLGEMHRAKIEELAQAKTLRQQVELYEVAALFAEQQGEVPPKADQGRDVQPGRDARTQPTPGRAQAPATRSADALPATRAEWMSIVRDPDKSRMRKYMPMIVNGTFDPDSLT